MKHVYCHSLYSRELLRKVMKHFYTRQSFSFYSARTQPRPLHREKKYTNASVLRYFLENKTSKLFFGKCAKEPKNERGSDGRWWVGEATCRPPLSGSVQEKWLAVLAKSENNNLGYGHCSFCHETAGKSAYEWGNYNQFSLNEHSHSQEPPIRLH